MAQILKQSTAIEVKVGPFLDSTDGVTAETGLTITQSEVLLAKNAGDWAQKNESTSLVHESNGWYRCLLDTTDTNTLGMLMLQIAESGALPVWETFWVVTANVYDTLFSTDILDVSVTEWLGTAAATPTVNGVPEVDVTHWLGTAAATPTVAGVPEVDLTHIAGSAVSTSTAQLGVNAVQAGGTAWGSGAITAASIAADAITAAKIADGAIDAATFAANAINAAKLDPDVATELNAAVLAILGTPAGASISADIAAIEAQTDDIGAAGAGLTAVPWNAAWDAEVQSEVQDALDAVLADSVPADGSRPSLAQAAYMIVQFLTERAVSGTTVTVKKVDGTTTLMTFTLDDATSPTSITRAT